MLSLPNFRLPRSWTLSLSAAARRTTPAASAAARRGTGSPVDRRAVARSGGGRCGEVRVGPVRCCLQLNCSSQDGGRRIVPNVRRRSRVSNFIQISKISWLKVASAGRFTPPEPPKRPSLCVYACACKKSPSLWPRAWGSSRRLHAAKAPAANWECSFRWWSSPSCNSGQCILQIRAFRDGTKNDSSSLVCSDWDANNQ